MIELDFVMCGGRPVDRSLCLLSLDEGVDVVYHADQESVGKSCNEPVVLFVLDIIISLSTGLLVNGKTSEHFTNVSLPRNYVTSSSRSLMHSAGTGGKYGLTIRA